MVRPADPGIGAKVSNVAVADPELFRVPMKLEQIGVLIRSTTKLVKISQFRGSIAVPPGSGVPGSVPVTLPRMR